jgi:hypothetical protein
MENALRKSVEQSLAKLAKAISPDMKTLNPLFKTLALLDKTTNHVKLTPSLQVIGCTNLCKPCYQHNYWLLFWCCTKVKPKIKCAKFFKQLHCSYYTTKLNNVGNLPPPPQECMFSPIVTFFEPHNVRNEPCGDRR